MELVFEEADMDAFLEHIKRFSIEYVHDTKELSCIWRYIYETRIRYCKMWAGMLLML